LKGLIVNCNRMGLTRDGIAALEETLHRG